MARRRILSAGVCYASMQGYPGFSSALLAGAKDFIRPKGIGFGARKIWSTMSPEERDRHGRKIREAFQRLAPLKKLTGWTGQAWLHKQFCSNPGDVHRTSSFLLWHRAFVFFHERLVQGNDRGYRLPVWDWEANTAVPSIYNGWTPVPGSNCVYQRDPIGVPIDACMLQAWLLSNNFSEFAGPVTSGPTLGNAQGGPHSLVHLNLAAFMSNFEVAAFDPVFYAHHTNVDRFWCAWLKHYQGTPGFDAVFPDEDWYFYDIQQGVVRVNVRKWKDFFMDPRNLGYEYDPPAHVFLYDFDVVRLKQNGNGLSVDLASLFVFLNKIILVENISVGVLQFVRGVFHLAQDVPALLASILQRFPHLVLPMRLEVQAAGINPGQYYAIGVAGPDLSNNVRLGGFGIFGPAHHEAHNLAAAVCIRLASLLQFFRILATGQAQLVYGSSSSDGNSVVSPKRLSGVKIEIRYPRLDKDLKAFLVPYAT